MSLALEAPIRVQPRPVVHRATGAWLDRPAVQVWLLSLWSLFLFLYGIHQGDLYRTEGLRAIVGAEMYRSGDWIVPRLYGEPILTKPPFFYWCIALTGHLFGEVTTWSARLPAALAGWVAVLIVYFTLRRYYGSSVGLLAGLALPVSALWLDKASSAEIDTMLVMWVLAAWACFLRVLIPSGSLPPGGGGLGWGGTATWTSTVRGQGCDPSPPAPLPQGERGGWWIAALLCVAGGVLTKWTGFLFFYAMVLPTLAWHGRLRELFRWPHLLAALLGAAVVCSWLAAVVAELGWTQVWSALWREGAPRVVHSKNASEQLVLETLLHPFKVLAISLPWSAIVLWAWWRRRDSGRTRGQRVVERSLLGWALAGTVMMTIFPDHNTRQSFSLVPAWTLMGVLSLRQLVDQPHLLKRVILGGLAVWIVVKLVYVEVVIPARFAKRPDLTAQAATLRAFVPPSTFLYLRAVKDECLMFNYAQPVRRLAGWDQVPSSEVHCVLTEHERQTWPPVLAIRIVAEQPLRDAQGDPLVVVRLEAASIR